MKKRLILWLIRLFLRFLKDYHIHQNPAKRIKKEGESNPDTRKEKGGEE